jgi:L-arabinose isomerase
MNRRPKIGLLLLTAEWFADIGAHGGSFGDLPRLLDEDAAAIEAALGADLDVVNPGVLATAEQARDAVGAFRAAEVDAVVACQITWGEDWPVIAALEALPDMPVLLWCYVPWREAPDPMTMVDLFRSSGPVGVLQASGPIKRMGRRVGFAYGPHTSAETCAQIVAFSRAAMAARGLRSLTIGVLPYRCDQMSGTWVDEARLRHRLGPSLRYISTHDYLATCKDVSEADVDDFVAHLRETYPVAETVTDAGLRKAARASLGLAALAEVHDLDAIALEDVGEELHRVVGLRPCLTPPGLYDRAVVSMEADAGAAVGLWVLKTLAGGTPMYTEVFTVDAAANTLIVGHAGMHDAPNLVSSPDEILIEPDGEYVESEPDSAWMRFRVRGGRVTLLNVFCDVDRFKFTVARGEALDGPPRLLGSPHAVVRLTTPLPAFFARAVRTGVTQHWAMVHGDVVAELRALAEIVGVEAVDYVDLNA